MPPPKRTFKNSNTPEPVKKPKGKIEKIDFGEYEQEVMRIWKGLPSTKLLARWKERGVKGSYNPGTQPSRMNKIKALIGYNGSNLAGHCCECGTLNTHLLKQKIEGAVLVTRYCDDHVPK